MRVEAIGLYSNDLEVVRFNMVRPDPSNPYTIKALTGLDAEELIAQYYATGLTSGKSFNELRMKPREISARIDLKPNYRLSQHPADLRGVLLKAIASSRTGQIQLRFFEGGICWGAISGFITKFEAPVTVRDTEVQFTMKCEDPIIRSLTPTSQNNLDTFSTTGDTIIDPISTSPHGFKLKITFTATTSEFKIRAVDSDWFFRIDQSFDSGDILYFSSEYGDKYLYVDTGSITGLMDRLDPNSIWPMLFPGENAFIFESAGFTWEELYWTETHWGI